MACIKAVVPERSTALTSSYLTNLDDELEQADEDVPGLRFEVGEHEQHAEDGQLGRTPSCRERLGSLSRVDGGNGDGVAGLEGPAERVGHVLRRDEHSRGAV